MKRIWCLILHAAFAAASYIKASFRSPQPRDSSNVSKIEATPALSLVTTIENLGEEVIIEDSQQPHRCTATPSIVTTETFIDDIREAEDEGTTEAQISDTPLESSPSTSSLPKGVSIAKVTTIPEPSEIAIAAAAPRVSVESVQVIASSEMINRTDSPGSEQRRYELKCGDEFYVVDVDQRRGRPFTLYKKQESITRPPPGYKMGQQGSGQKGENSSSSNNKKNNDELEIEALAQASKTDAALKTLSK